MKFNIHSCSISLPFFFNNPLTFKCWTFQLTLRPQAGLRFPLGWNHQQPRIILLENHLCGRPKPVDKAEPSQDGKVGLAFLHSSSLFPPSPRQLRILPQILGYGDLGLPSFFWLLRRKGKVVFSTSDPEQGTDTAQEVWPRASLCFSQHLASF